MLQPGVAETRPLEIDVWSDIVCPWCYLGKRRLEQALSASSVAATLRWRAFQLDASAPRRVEVTVSELLQRKYGMSREQVEASQTRLVELGQADGIEYRFDVAKTGNTRDAHRLVAFAASRGRGDEMVEALMRGYFTEGLPIGEVDTLVEIGAGCGFDPDEIRAALSGSSWSDSVDADLRLAREIGVRGVPFFVLAGRYAVSGAQPVEVLRDAIARGAQG